MFLNSLSGRFLILTVIFVMLAEILIFVPSIALFREDFLSSRLERAQIASLSLLADDMIDTNLEDELLRNAGVLNVVLLRDEMRELMLTSNIPIPIAETYDLRDPSAVELMVDAMARLVNPNDEVIRLLGHPVREAGILIEVTMETSQLRAAMIDFGVRVFFLSAVISIFTAALLFLAVRSLLVKPIRGVVDAMMRYAEEPEDVRRVIMPTASVQELLEAENALKSMQTDLTNALRQKERLAQLGGAVAKISHDLRNILTSAQLFADRIEASTDPTVKRMAPKLLNSISRAVHLCESTLAFGKAEEPPPTLDRVQLHRIVEDILASESLANVDGNITFREDVPPSLVVRCDPEQLYRVLQNLVRNARQAISATKQMGKVSIEAQETDNAWQIFVSDTGPGLPPKAQEHLFRPFQGGTRKEGTGLGLAIAAELIKGHGGRLELLSTDERGTCFAINLPKSITSLGAAAE